MFRLGVGNDTTSDTRCALHNDHFAADERCFETGIAMFTSFVLENQDGIDLEENV